MPYQVLSILGVGAQGKVGLCIGKNNELYAIKCIQNDLYMPDEEINSVHLRNIEREIRIMVKLNFYCLMCV
jgi:hypothetical protein